MLAAPSLAHAAIPSIPEGAGADNGAAGDIACTVQSGGNAGERHCAGIFTTFDGAPIDVNVGFPAAPATGPDGDFPIIGVFHGWGGAKIGLTSGGMQEWLDAGYAVFSMSDRGWGNSCGAADPKRPTPACLNGYNHLLDTRYEVRDAQEVFEALADRGTDTDPATGLIDPRAIGATGGSYGGGMSMALGALRNRKMLKGEELLPTDGMLVPWVSDGGKQMEIAAAQPDIPWTDLPYSLQPNGATLDYVADAPYLGPNGDKRIGVIKQSFVAGLYALGAATSNYAPPGADPDADLTRWYAQVNAGEPYDTPLADDLVDELTKHHSSYYIDDSVAPAPLLISNGWTDDLFPPDEAIRFYNRTRTDHSGTPISLIFTDHGHQRGQNKGPDTQFRSAERHNWFDFYVKGQGPEPYQGVQTLTTTCGTNSNGASGPFDQPGTDVPFRASSWAAISPGEIRTHFPDQLATILPQGGSPAAGQAFDPIAGGGACATTSGADQQGVANYRLPAAPAAGYTLMGSPTIIADFFSPGPNSQIAARLLDVAPDGNERLVARGLWRPEVNVSAGGGTRQVFQLHPNGWTFADGHIPKLELLPADQPYGRNSNGQAPITVTNLELRLPVIEAPGAHGGLVDAPAGKVLPPGYALAADFVPPVDNDADDDGWSDDTDNCPADANADQADEDGDGVGDVCDPVDDDRDDDGVENSLDNCPDNANPLQEDGDNDGTGDACDATNNNDRDGDGRDNDDDNCPDNTNPGQEDGDGDGTGDVCDAVDNRDIDGDGRLNEADNCPSNPNPGQEDTDGDGVGNACDGTDDDPDLDTVLTQNDNCPDMANQSQDDGEGDGIGDACDADDDNDGVEDSSDGCPAQAAMTADGCPLVPVPPNTSASTGSPAAGGVAGKKCKKRSKRKAGARGKAKGQKKVKRCKRKRGTRR